MPRTTITEDNKFGSDTERVPSLKLGKDERGRIACWDVQVLASGQRELAPVQEWVHRLQAPKIIDGRPQRTTRKGKEGQETTDWDFDFLGTPICLGDFGTLRSKGLDAANCPVCASSLEDSCIQAPFPRFAMNVIRYGTRHGSFELAVPFSAAVIAWAFPASRFDKLADIKREDAPEGDISAVDLRLGPCTDPGYQKYEIAVQPGAPVWAMSPELTAYVKMLWDTPGNRASDDQLSALCGRRVVNRAYLAEDIARARRQWAIANQWQNAGSGSGTVLAFPGAMAGLQADAAAAFAGAEAASVPQVPTAPVGFPVAAPVGVPAVPVAAPVAAPVMAAPAVPVVAPVAAPVAPVVPAAVAAPVAAPVAPVAPAVMAAPMVPSVPVAAAPVAAPAAPMVPAAVAAPVAPVAVPEIPALPVAAPVAAAPAVPLTAVPQPQAAPVAPVAPAAPAAGSTPFDQLINF